MISNPVTDFLDRQQLRNSPEYWTSTSSKGVVSSAHYRATDAGVEVLKKGGDAVDAAIAVSVALGVAEPNGSGLGGMTMMMIHRHNTGETIMVEGPCHAPVKATPELVRESHRKRGYQAIALPSNPAVLGFVHQQYGTLPLGEILNPAFRLAQNGLLITPIQSRLRHEYAEALLKGNAAQFILSDGNIPPATGSIVTNPVLAGTIDTIIKNGFDSFYTGETGQVILSDMIKNNGFISSDDMAEVPLPTLSKPLKSRFGSWEVLAPPPPCGGLVLIEMLNLFSELAPADFDPDSPEAALLFSVIIQKTRSDRRKFRLMPLDPLQWDGPDFSGKEYARTSAEKLRMQHGLGETTHFNIVDGNGNVVAVTQSIERSYGAKVATPELGFLYNGFMKGFKIENKKHPHYLKPGAVARSNATPTLVFKNGKPKYAIGSTGSERMVSGIFQVLVRLYKGQSPFDAVKAPRLHCNPDSQVFMEQARFSGSSIELLKSKGFEVIPYDSEWAFSSGGLHMLSIEENGEATGVADPRRDGSAGGVF